MMKTVVKGKQNLNEMPWPLRLLTQGLLVSAVLLPIVFFTNKWTGAGEDISSQELWARGIGQQISGIGLLLPLIGCCFIYRWKWSRHLAVIVFFVIGLAGVAEQELPTSKADWITSLVEGGIGLFWILYVSFNGRVRRYFTMKTIEPSH